MVAMGHRFVPTSWSMHVVCSVPRALMVGRALIGVRVGHGKNMLVDVIAMGMVQVTVVQVVDMVVVHDGRMATIFAVDVIVVGVLLTIVAHSLLTRVMTSPGRDWSSRRPVNLSLLRRSRPALGS